MGMEIIPRANRESGVPVAPSVPEQPLDTVPGSGQGFGKDTPLQMEEGTVPTTMGCWLCSHWCSPPGFAVCSHCDTRAVRGPGEVDGHKE